MNPRVAVPLLSLVFAACASTGGAAPRVFDPLPLTSAPAPETAPDGWQNLDLNLDGVPGTSTERAISDLLSDRSPARTVVVAVIDGGVDTAHVDLRDALWRNPGETPGNARDDDGNGYVDDIYGWNFIGGPDGENVDFDTFELTRLHAQCLRGTGSGLYDCAELQRTFDETRADLDAQSQQISEIESVLAVIIPALTQATGGGELSDDAVEAIETTDPRLQQMRDIYLQISAAGITEETLNDIKEDVEGRRRYGLDPDFDPRDIVGDDFGDGMQRTYGNGDVTGPNADHGSHVAGIIAGARNDRGNDGIAAPHARIMAVRAVPNGDERDKDVANAIRYAVDQGAQIINMSFGKDFSPSKSLVDEAVRYGDERGVLFIHAAGNDGHDLEIEDNFPTSEYDGGGGRAEHWITVGASNWKVDSLATPFSNYGRTKVDLFAPGIEILSAAPGDEWVSQQGTSMAAPVVSGVAALLMAYFPELTAADVKEILLASSVKYVDRVVPRPGDASLAGASASMVPFGELSSTGGVVNTYEAVRLALLRQR